MQDRALRDLDVVAQVGPEIEALVFGLGRVSNVAIKEHHVGDVVGIGDDLTNEFGTVPFSIRFLGHDNLSLVNVRPYDGAGAPPRQSGAPEIATLQ
jgi:hypothetical protein